jgi:hypothetical protein
MRQAIWTVFLAAIGLAAIATQLDRQARHAPHIARFVPDALSSFALYRKAAQFVDQDNPVEAMQATRQLIAIRPIPAEHLSMLAYAQILSGDAAKGTQTIQQAARRGWRDVPTQRAMFGLARDGDDGAEMARRYIAMSVMLGRNEMLAEITPQAFASEEARETAAQLVAAPSLWSVNFMRYTLRELPASHALDIMIRVEAKGGAVDCDAARFVLNSADYSAEKTDNQLGALGCN